MTNAGPKKKAIYIGRTHYIKSRPIYQRQAKPTATQSYHTANRELRIENQVSDEVRTILLRPTLLLLEFCLRKPQIWLKRCRINLKQLTRQVSSSTRATVLGSQLSRHQVKLFLLPSHQHLAQRSSISFLDVYQLLFFFFFRLGLFGFWENMWE